ncbi:MAG: hypothetical protein Fur0024_2780 [Patescibacteria group bacterium]
MSEVVPNISEDLSFGSDYHISFDEIFSKFNDMNMRFLEYTDRIIKIKLLHRLRRLRKNDGNGYDNGFDVEVWIEQVAPEI